MDPHPYDTPEVRQMVEETKNTFLGGLLAAATIAIPFIILL